MAAPLLRVEDLRTQFFTSRGIVHAVDGISFNVGRGETVGIVGESGSGKTMTAFSILRLVPDPGRIVSGRILFKDQDVVQMNDDDVREFRGNDVAMIFQDPLTSLDPTKTIGYQVAEPVRLHKGASKAAARARARLIPSASIGSAPSRMPAVSARMTG